MIVGTRTYALTLVLAVAVIPASAFAQGVFPQSVASGDPRADSVVLWTRVVDFLEPYELRVEVALDEDFTEVFLTRGELSIDADNDYCVKVRVSGLEAYTTYYYRFVLTTGSTELVSPVGRTKTAPRADHDDKIRFAVIYCQDYVGRYYNSLLKLLRDHDEDIDFIVHLGDYVYETTKDPSFQDPGADRQIEFTDIEGAIDLGGGNLAAASLSNYRTLYRTYRSDPILQQVHERWPMVVIWDDHEFSNDSWGATATYTNGRTDEYDPQRKQNSERAFFEWVPTEVGLGDDDQLEIDASILYPNARLFRDFQFGSSVHLVMTDTRSYRPDHLIPEDAFPGHIAVDEATIRGIVGDVTFASLVGNLDPYIDMRLLGGQLKTLKETATLVVAQAYMMELPSLGFVPAVRLAEEKLNGPVSTLFINAAFEAAGFPPPFTSEVQALLPKGISYLLMGKRSMFTSTGSRTQVIHDAFNLFAAFRAMTTGGAAQDVFGGQQLAWLVGVLQQSSAQWKVIGNSVMMTPLVVDFTNPFIAQMLDENFPDQLRTRLNVNVEDFNGFPQARDAFLMLLGSTNNAVVLSGDIHAAFITKHGNGVYEFTGPAVSSATNGELVARVVSSDPIFGSIPGIGALLENLDLLFKISSENDELVSQSDIKYANLFSHGFMIVEADEDMFIACLKQVPSDLVRESYYDRPAELDALFTDYRYIICRDDWVGPCYPDEEEE
jgi:alkaline phosphatase D